MGDFKQTFAWSNSRVKMLRECMYKYYLNYYQSWFGWDSNAPIEKKQAYMLKQMTNLPMWVGTIVHDEIESIINEIKDKGDCRSVSAALLNTTQALRKGWIQSKNKQWKQNPKWNINLAEHYFDREVSKNKLDGFKNKVQTCIKAFYDSPIFKMLHEVTESDWLSLEDFQKFTLSGGEEVSVKIDCGFRQDGKVYLLDWKTGKVDTNVVDQLVTYAMYALKQGWTNNPENIIIVPVYLAAYFDHGDKAMPHITVDMTKIKRQAKIIQDESPLLQQAHDNKDNPDFFKHTDNEQTCKWCNFYGTICDGARTEIMEGETPF